MAVAYSARNVTVTEGENCAVFEVDRTGTREDLNEPSSVDYRTLDATAKAEQDYQSATGTLTFAAGETRKQISVTILPEAFETSGRDTFILQLEGFGAATARISHVPSHRDVQGYWFVPSSDAAEVVPTKETATAMAKAQMDVEKFSDPPDDRIHVRLPQSYVRIGFARPDMNHFERVIAESEAFFARGYKDGKVVLDGDGVPKEPGSMRNFAIPRNINRKEKGWEEEKEGNAHLDGIFLFTKGNMTTSTGGTASYVVGKDYVRHVGGETRFNFMSEVTRTYLSPTDGILRLVEGVAKIGGLYLDYEVKRTRTLEVAMEEKVSYSIGVEFSLCATAQIELYNGLKFEVSNAAKLEVTGLEIGGKIGLDGSYEADMMIGELISTRSEEMRVATEEIVLQIDPWAGTARQAIAATYAGLVADMSGLASIGSVVPFAMSDAKFDDLANPDHMNTDFAQTMDVGQPSTFALLAATGVAMMLLLKAAQKIAEIPRSTTPKIQMDKDKLVLSVGPSKITITSSGIELGSANITSTSFDHVINSLSTVFDQGAVTVKSSFKAQKKSFFLNDVDVAGEVDALSLAAGA